MIKWRWLLLSAVIAVLVGSWWWKRSISQPPILVQPPLTVVQTSPLDKPRERVTKKRFGEYFNDRFTGYHTGVDLETFPGEQNTAVSVKAICDGKIRLAEYASGYGGVVVQDCQWDGQNVTVIYGHLKIASVAKKVGDRLQTGESIGILGAANSQETDGERKHLHLGIHKGSDIDIRGYVSSPSELSAWINPCPDDTMATWNICSQ